MPDIYDQVTEMTETRHNESPPKVQMKSISVSLSLALVAILSCCDVFAEARTYKKVNPDLTYRFVNLLKDMPEKDEFETTVEFKKRTDEYFKKASDLYENTVYIAEKKASPSYDADKKLLKVYVPFNITHGKGINMRAVYREDTGTETVDTIYTGRKTFATYINHNLYADIESLPPSLMQKCTKYASCIEITLPANLARKYDGTYRWIFGVLYYNMTEARYGRYTTARADNDSEVLEQIRAGEVGYFKVHHVPGKLAFVALVADDAPEPLWGYFTTRNKKENVAEFLN